MELAKSLCKCKHISAVAVVGAESKEKEEPYNSLQIFPEVLESVGKPQHLPLGYSKVIYSSDGFLGKYHHVNQLSYLEIFSASYEV